MTAALRRDARNGHPVPATAFRAAVIALLLLSAVLFAGVASAAPAYEVSTVGMENVVLYNGGYHVVEGTSYIKVPFNITLEANEVVRGFFIMEDSSGSTPLVLVNITNVELAVTNWNDARNTSMIAIAAASSTADEFNTSSNRVFLVTISTADFVPGTYTLRFTVDTAWSAKPLAATDIDDWKNAECVAEFDFTVEGNKTIHYEGNGETAGIMADQVVPFNATVTLTPNAFIRTGYDFNQWNTHPAGLGFLYYDAGTYVIYDNLTLYAQWTRAGTSSIYGTITNANPYDDITLTLIGAYTATRVETVPAGNTSYAIADVPRGTYNLNPTYYNATDNFTYALLYLVDVVSGTPTECNIVFPLKRIKPTLNISTNGITPKVAVGGLNEEMILQAGSLSDDLTAELVFSAEAHPASAIPNDSGKIRQKIQETHPESATDDVLYLDSTVELITRYGINGTEILPRTQIHETNTVLEVCIPYDFAGKSAVYVYRLHDGNASILTQLYQRPTGAYQDGTYFLDYTNGVIRVYASKYSIYSVAYTPAPVPPHPDYPTERTIILKGNETPVPTVMPTATPTAAPGSDEPMDSIMPIVIGGVILAAIIAGVAILAGVLSRRRKNKDDDELGGHISTGKK